MADEADAAKTGPGRWLVLDTRTVIVVWMMFSTFLLMLCLMAWGVPKGESGQLLNTLLGMYVGTGMITSINWWMGSAKGSDANNKMADANSEVVRKLSTTVGTGGNGPQPSVPVPPWWSRLSDAEKNAITAASVGPPPDPRVAAFVTASQVGAATPDDLAYLVSKGLLTQDRADAVKGT